jgi:MFS family permease
MSKNPFSLLSKKRFAPLFITQFLGAFNDSLFRNALIVSLAFSTTTSFLNPNTLVNLGAALFIIPYFLFSALAGQLADKFEKTRLIRFIKISEIGLAILAAIGFYFHHLTLLMIALFLLGTHSTFFGPIKYSILPQQLKESELMAGNGLVEMGTFIAILIGTIMGAFLVGIPIIGLHWVSITMLMVAIIGLITSLFIPNAKPPVPNLLIDWHPLRQTVQMMKKTYQHKIPYMSIIGISWFWLYGSIFLTQIANYTKLILSGSEQVATILLTTFSVSIGLGSMLCTKLSKNKIEMGLVPLGAIGLSIFAIDIAFAHGTKSDVLLSGIAFLSDWLSWRILLDISFIGIFGGFFIVPLYALLQNRTDSEERSRVIAANNVINAIFMTVASLIAIVFLNIGFSIPQLFLLTGILNALVAIYIFRVVPEFVDRFVTWMSIHMPSSH